jgi:hypothetical protein
MIIAMIVPMIEASTRAHVIAAAPATILVAVRFVVIAGITDTHITFHADAGHGARIKSGQRNRRNRAEQQSMAKVAHFGSALVSFSLHSIKPTSAPAGSETTATMPP